MIRLPSQFEIAGRALRQALRERSAPPGAVVLAYHDVVVAEPAENEWVVSVERLRSHVKTLRRLGFQIVPLPDLMDRYLTGESVDQMAALTFDDALAGVYRFGAPALADLDAPATVFVVSDAPAGPPAWWPNSGPIMTNDELLDLASVGWTIGAHSATHSSLPSVDPAALVDEVTGCRKRLVERGFDEPDFFAYPFGHYNENVVAAMADAGFRASFSFLNGRILGELDRLRLPRLTMGIHSTPSRLAYHLLRAADTWPDHQLPAVVGDASQG